MKNPTSVQKYIKLYLEGSFTGCRFKSNNIFPSWISQIRSKVEAIFSGCKSRLSLTAYMPSWISFSARNFRPFCLSSYLINAGAVLTLFSPQYSLSGKSRRFAQTNFPLGDFIESDASLFGFYARLSTHPSVRGNDATHLPKSRAHTALLSPNKRS
jgi:hypothetical protein